VKPFDTKWSAAGCYNIINIIIYISEKKPSAPIKHYCSFKIKGL
jgi:hypothetical protein